MHIDVALDIDEPMMEGVHLRHKERQRREVGLFDGEELSRTRMEMALCGWRSLCRRRRVPGH